MKLPLHNRMIINRMIIFQNKEPAEAIAPAGSF